MRLRDLLDGFEYTLIQGSLEIPVTKVIEHTKDVVPGGVFICIKGATVDSHQLLDHVVPHGVAALIVEQEVTVPESVTVIMVENTQVALAQIAAAYFEHPERRLRIIGVTGTKGKTTTTYMIKHMLEKAGIKTGLIGTVEVLYGDVREESVNTTPDSFVLFRYLKEMVQAGCESVVMEVSSQGLMLHRVACLEFDYAVFTNLSPDHIGPKEHKDFEEYLNCKSLLFRQSKIGIINIDDIHYAQVLKKHRCIIETYGIQNIADLRAEEFSRVQGEGYFGIQFQVVGCIQHTMELNMPGLFNVYNALAAMAVCRHFGVSKECMAESLRTVNVRGRLEMVPTGEPYMIMIDYAHNPASLEALLKTVKEYNPARIVCLFGCGGSRARLRRLYMGETAAELADFTIITSDNPRVEEPEAIILDILKAFDSKIHSYITIPDRREAIRYAIDHAREGDVIILAGKGHENYQEIKGVKYPMDEREIVNQFLEDRRKRINYKS